MTAVEADYLVRDTKLFQSRLLRRDQIRFGEVVLPPEYDRERRTSRQRGCVLGSELGRQQPRPQDYAIGIHLPARYPARDSGSPLRKTKNPKPDSFAGHNRKDLVMEQVEIADVVFDLVLPIFRRHPARAYRSIWRVWPSLWRRQVVARESFGRNEESIFAFDWDKARQKARRQLTVSMADDPHLGEGCVERAHHRVARGPWDAKMPLFEAADLALGDR